MSHPGSIPSRRGEEVDVSKVSVRDGRLPPLLETNDLYGPHQRPPRERGVVWPPDVEGGNPPLQTGILTETIVHPTHCTHEMKIRLRVSGDTRKGGGSTGATREVGVESDRPQDETPGVTVPYRRSKVSAQDLLLVEHTKVGDPGPPNEHRRSG